MGVFEAGSICHIRAVSLIGSNRLGLLDFGSASTQTRPFSTAVSAARGMGILARTRPAAGSKRTTEPSSTAQTEPKPIDSGPEIGTVHVRPVPESTRVTDGGWVDVTQTEPNPYVASIGLAATRITFTSRSVVGSMRRSAPVAPDTCVTHTEPPPTAMPW